MATKNKENVEETLETPVEVEKKYDFKQAFRVFKKNNPIFSKYDSEAIELFCMKKMGKKEAPMKEWVDILQKY